MGRSVKTIMGISSPFLGPSHPRHCRLAGQMNVSPRPPEVDRCTGAVFKFIRLSQERSQ